MYVARNTTNTSNKLRVVYYHIILYYIYQLWREKRMSRNASV